MFAKMGQTLLAGQFISGARSYLITAVDDSGWRRQVNNPETIGQGGSIVFHSRKGTKSSSKNQVFIIKKQVFFIFVIFLSQKCARSLLF